MPQFARATSILTAGGWTGSHTDINEAVANDATFISSPSPPVNNEVIIQLGSVTDPVSSSGHFHRVRSRKNLAGGGTITITPRLMQTNTEVHNPGGQILTENFTTYGFTLPAAAADSITNYGDLRYRINANQT